MFGPTATASTRTLAASLADRVRAEIERGEHPPGTALRQEELAQRLGTSRIPLREAFRLLEAEGLIVIEPNRGAFVRTQSRAEVIELFDIRLSLETALIRRACKRPARNRIARIRALEAQVAAAETSEEWLGSDDAYHTAIYELADRPMTLAIIATLRRSLAAYYALYLKPATRAHAWAKEHAAITGAVARGDARAAAGALRTHLKNSRAALVAAIDAGTVTNNSRDMEGE